jgi:hypothetical protein
MKCVSCSADIPPQFVKAIQINLCPVCGGAIMDEAAKILLSELTDAMSKMPNDPEGLAGWLLSNYNLHKIGTAEPTVFFNKSGKKQPADQQQEDFSHLKINKNNSYNEYLRRAGVSKDVLNRKPLEQIAQEIQANAEAEEGLENYEGEDQQEYEQQMMEQENSVVGPPKIRAKDVLGNNSLVVSDPNVAPLSAEEIRQVIAISQQNAGKDLSNSELHPALQLDRMKRLQASEAVANGGKAGMISRRG